MNLRKYSTSGTQSCEMSVRQERNCSFEMHFWIKFKFKPMWYEILEAKWVFQVEIFNVIYSFFYLWKQSNVQILVICDHNNLLVFCKMWFGPVVWPVEFNIEQIDSEGCLANVFQLSSTPLFHSYHGYIFSYWLRIYYGISQKFSWENDR